MAKDEAPRKIRIVGGYNPTQMIIQGNKPSKQMIPPTSQGASPNKPKPLSTPTVGTKKG